MTRDGSQRYSKKKNPLYHHGHGDLKASMSMYTHIYIYIYIYITCNIMYSTT